ncbi:putative triose phosphate/phosphate translocator [Babesia divergens]|uniref:Triose phosphate/phosphate translocator n=1 Tax=Babesia divergens TaxID=32595 RepID=A0AAD9LH75_BABDI|nr:putative triose phosphate/phosphate translocator [Babesia divergens]
MEAFIRQSIDGTATPTNVGKRTVNQVNQKYNNKRLNIKTTVSYPIFAVRGDKHDTKVLEKGGIQKSTALHGVPSEKVAIEPRKTVGSVLNSNESFAIPSLKSAFKSISLLSLWYAGTVMYNVENKKALNMCPLPKTIAALQMLIGIPFFLTRWLVGIKPVPTIYTSNAGVQEENPKAGILESIKMKVRNGLCRLRNTINSHASLIKQSAMFSMLHLLSVTALGAGAISFVHIVKASEPLFVSAISLLTGSGSMSPVTFLTLLPILGGVSMASLKDLNFSPLALASTLASNVFASIRRIEAKKFFKQDLSKIGQNLDAANVSSLVTIFSSLILAPLSLLEISKWAPVYRSILYKYSGKGMLQLARHIVLSGFFYTLYNEVSFIALSQLAPVSHAVANTLKRIFLILTSSLLFKTKLTSAGLYGSATAISGAMLYSLSKHYYG